MLLGPNCVFTLETRLKCRLNHSLSLLKDSDPRLPTHLMFLLWCSEVRVPKVKVRLNNHNLIQILMMRVLLLREGGWNFSVTYLLMNSSSKINPLDSIWMRNSTTKKKLAESLEMMPLMEFPMTLISTLFLLRVLYTSWIITLTQLPRHLRVCKLAGLKTLVTIPNIPMFWREELKISETSKKDSVSDLIQRLKLFGIFVPTLIGIKLNGCTLLKNWFLTMKPRIALLELTLLKRTLNSPSRLRNPLLKNNLRKTEMENGLFFKTGPSVLWPAEVVNSFCKEFANPLLEMEPPVMKVPKSFQENVTPNPAPNLELMENK